MMLSTWCPPKWFASHPWPCFVPSCNNGRLWMTARRGGERRVVCRRNRLNIIKPFCPRFLVSKKNSNGRWCYIDHPCFPCGSPQPVEEKWHRGCENPHRMDWKMMIAAVGIKEEQKESFHLVRASLLKLATSETDELLIEVANEFIRADPEKRFLVELALESILKNKKEEEQLSSVSKSEHRVVKFRKRRQVVKSSRKQKRRYDWKSIDSPYLWEDNSKKTDSSTRNARDNNSDNRNECQQVVLSILHNVLQQLSSSPPTRLPLYDWWMEWEYFCKERMQQKQLGRVRETDRHIREQRVVQVLERIQGEEDEVTIDEIEIAAKTVARIMDYSDSYWSDHGHKKNRRKRSTNSDSFSTYLTEIGKVHRLSLEEEKEICQEIAFFTHLEAVREDLRRRIGRLPREHEWAMETNMSVPELRGKLIKGRRAKNRMVAANLRLVICFAKRFRNRGVAFQDLVQEGSIGLIRGVEKYDANRGFRFSTYASWWIRQGIHKALLECSKMFRLPVHVNEMIKEIRRCSYELMNILGREPTKLEIAMKVGMPEEKVIFLLQRAQTALSLEMPLRGSDSSLESRTLGDVVSSTASPSPEDSAFGTSLRYDLERALSQLDFREREVIRMRFGLDDGRTKSLGEVGSLFCVTRERVRQIETRALRKLRDPRCNMFLKEYMEWISDERPGMKKPMAVVD